MSNPWDIARAVWPGCFEEPWQDEQCDRGWELPTVWVVRSSQFVRPVAREGLEPLVPGWDSWGRIPKPVPVVPQVAVTPMTLQPDGAHGAGWWAELDASPKVHHMDQLASTAEQNSAAIVWLRANGHRWWCKQDPFYALDAVLDVQLGRRFKADHRAVETLVRAGEIGCRASLRYPRDAP